MNISALIRLILSPTKTDLFNSEFARKHLARRVLRRPFRNRPKNSDYANERFADELPEDLSWIRRKHFILLGDNWLESENRKPVAFMWGFNDWKRDFIPGFLPEYRTLALKRRTSPLAILSACRRFKRDGVVFVTWSYNETRKLRLLRRLVGAELFRVEDGFVRSASLGARHTPPESWVLDRAGMYFNGQRPSDLENIINSHDFTADRDLVGKSQMAISLIKKLGTTKYNLRTADTAENILGPKAKKRVLVIGQVESDASIAKGNAVGWTNDLLLRLAIEENPDAQIIYRPHPDVAAGLRAKGRNTLPLNVFLLDKVEISLREVFDLVDHAYTITSLSGFEALLHGVKVTVVGAPFYAGWGLTDDRQEHPRRTRTLSLEELFAAAYILYPRYRGTPGGDSWTGLIAAILAVTGDAELELKKAYQSGIEPTELNAVLKSRYWPAALSPENRELLQQKPVKDFLDKSGLYDALGRCPPSARVYIAYVVAGLLRDGPNLGPFLKAIRSLVDLQTFGQILLDIWNVRPDQKLVEHLIWHAEQSRDPLFEMDALPHLARVIGSDDEIITPPNSAVISIAAHRIENRDLESAEADLKKIALSGAFIEDVLWLLADICRLRLEFKSSAFLLNALSCINSGWRRPAVYSNLVTSSMIAGESKDAIVSLSALSRISSDRLQVVLGVAGDLAAAYGDFPFTDAFLAAGSEMGTSAQNLARARGLILNERHAEAEFLLRKTFNQKVDRNRFVFLLSQALSFQGKLKEAQKLLAATLVNGATSQLMSEAMRVAIMAGDYTWASNLVKQAESLGIEFAEVHRRKIMLGLGRIKESYRSFRDNKASAKIRSYLPETYVQSLGEIQERRPNSLVVIASSGPGDEIRFATKYQEMTDQLQGIDVTFTCDPRLLSIFNRSLPGLQFKAAERTRSLTSKSDLSKFSELPGSDLHSLADNDAWKLISAASAVSLDTDLLSDVMEGYESFSGKPILRAHPIHVEAARARFATMKKPIVGVSWRSSLTTHSRNEHYLSIAEMMPIFELEGIQFVNLQYDECSEELAYVEKRLPGRLVDLDGVDQYNDFEAVAACMEHMDLVISPVTTVTELAGALGRPTWLMSNSSELHWRVRPDTGRDVWHSTISHVEGDTLGSKPSLVRKIRADLECWLKDRSSQAQPAPPVIEKETETKEL